MRLHLAIFALLALAAPLSAQSTQSGTTRWFRGNTHTHTLESDGNTSPADVVKWYRDNGYDFVVITDHEKVTDPAPLNALHGVPGRFLVFPGEEVTQRIEDLSRPGPPRQAHVNGIGVTRAVLPLGERGMVRNQTIASTYARNLAEIVAAGGLPQVNHPNFGWSIRPDDMSELPDSTLFEVWNGQPRINNLGGDDGTGGVALSTDALWDTLLTRGRLLFGVATDDAHNFRPAQHQDFETARPGGGWVMVRADTLTRPAIVSALRAGQFYSTTGILLDDYHASPREIRLRIAKTGSRDDRRYRTEFVGRGGRVLAAMPGLTARYLITGDEGYVRARITDSNGRRAWMQPVRVTGR